jgi:outer membrane protein TolC
LFHSAPLNELIELSLAKQSRPQGSASGLVSGKGKRPGATRRLLCRASRPAFPPAARGSPGQIAPTPNSNAFLYNLFTPQVSVSYVPDVFGLNRRTVESLQAQEQAVRFQMIATYTTLTANVVVAAIQEASLQAQIDATRQLIDINSNMLQILQIPVRQRLCQRLDVAAQESQLAQVAATLPPLSSNWHSNDLLAVLAGRFPNQAPAEKFELASLQLPRTCR